MNDIQRMKAIQAYKAFYKTYNDGPRQQFDRKPVRHKHSKSAWRELRRVK